MKIGLHSKSLFVRLVGLFMCLGVAVNANAAYPAGTPVAINGKLHVEGTHLVNECGYAVQLRGMSTHGPQWFSNCICNEALQTLVDDWHISLFRIAMYVQEQGYVTNPSKWRAFIDDVVDQCGNLGIYCIIDWHVLNPGNPMTNLSESKEFWDYMSKKHGSKAHVIYEICNEPNGTDWSVVKQYAEQIIPIIRANDTKTPIVVGTPTWSQDVDVASQNKLSDSNVLYTLHFYAGSHGQALRSKAETAMNNGCAIFVTEFGTSSASGDGSYSPDATRTWISWMNQHGISWANWSFSDASEVSAALNSGSCSGKSWNNTSASGTFIKGMISEDPFTYTACNSQSSDSGNTDSGNTGGNTDSGNTGGNTDSGNTGGNDSGNTGGDSGNQGGSTTQPTEPVTYPELVNSFAEYKVYRVVNKNSGMVMSLNGSTADKGTLQQAKRDESDEGQFFRFRKSGDQYFLVNIKSNMVMTNSYNPNPGAQIVQQAESSYDNPSEKWSITLTDGYWFRIDNKSGNGTCIAVENASFDAGALVVQENFSSAANQLWGLEYVSDFDASATDIVYSESLALYPSMVNDEFHVYGDYESVSVLNVSGDVVASFKAQDAYNIANLPAGAYIVRVATANGPQQLKLVKK